ncbi:PAS domain S-box protein [Desulforhopalus vacuolatus]|uniref:PAS domain S-box protein n=1 Tax=Desulforhopalus vacuolatus TaxID=40414 RepID=UPI0019637AAC|nr:PAS domain S-box protein [Desulforhopalus vacuolatus]MBM9520967.1 PAS domain S-box protein [Desulforhopalus vacuolatus]
MKASSILIVEDEFIIAKDIETSLKNMGYVVCAIVSSGEEAIKKTQKEKPDLVLMDIILKGAIDGIEAARQIRSLFKIPIVYLTAYTDDNTLEKAKITEPYGYILKPFKNRELNNAIEISLYKNKMEKKLIESEERFKFLAENMADVVWTLDLNFQTTYVSPSIEKVLGFTPAERKQQPLEKMVTPESFKRIAENFSQERETEKMNADSDRVISMEVEYYHKNGTIVWTENSIKGMRDPDGKLIGIYGSSRDITEKKRAEIALIESEKKYRLLADNVADAIYTVNLETENLTYASPSIQKMLGYTAEEYLTLSTKDVITTESYIKQQKLLESLINKKQATESIELEAIHKDGHIIPVEIHARIVFDKQGNPVEILGVSRDITDRKQKETALRESEELYKSLFKNNQSAMLLIDPETLKIVDANPAAISYYGWSHKELIKKKITDINILSKEETIQEIQKSKNQQQNHFFFNHRLSNREIRNVEVYSGPITVNERDLLYSIVHDITEQKQMEKDLKEKTQTLNDILENAGDGICVSYNISEWPNVKFSHWNPRMTSITGYTLEEINQFGWYQKIYPDSETQQKAIERMTSMLQGKNIVAEEWTIVDKEKNIKTLSISTTILKTEENRTYVLGIMQDISERKSQEEQLRQSHKMESIGTIAGGIAHDFNNILYMIIGNVELALEDIPNWNPAYTNLEEIKSAGLRAAGIVKQLLNFSRKADLELKPIGIVTVINDALKLLRSTIPTTIEFRKHLPPAEITILADPIQINQVLINICTNAAQLMEDTGGVFEVSVTSVILNEEANGDYLNFSAGNYVKITLTDTGPGIPHNIIDRIFDPYFTTKEIGKGSGMGLSIVHGIVKNHNGIISVESVPGKGTTFTILFPVINEKPIMEIKKTEGILYGTEIILFVDDEQTITEMMQKVLERLGYRVETTMNPIEAIEMFQSKPDMFDLVISDMTMPQMTGSKLSKKLKEIRSDIPIIICTGHSSLINEEKAKELEIAAYVMKPVSMLEIAKTIREVLDK